LELVEIESEPAFFGRQASDEKINRRVQPRFRRFRDAPALDRRFARKVPASVKDDAGFLSGNAIIAHRQGKYRQYCE
jgi:hypothetical protein